MIKNLSKVIYAINNLFTLDKHESIKPCVFFSLINIFLNQYAELQPSRINYYKDQIYNIFEKFSMKDGTTPEIWDLYALFIESTEIEVNKNKEDFSQEEKEGYYKAICEIRLKQARTHMTADLWEKDELVVIKVAKVLGHIKNMLLKIQDQTYINEVNTFVVNLSGKIDKFYKNLEFEKKKLEG